MMLLAGMAHDLGQLAQQRLDVLSARERGGGGQLAGHPGDRQDDQLRVDLAHAQQPVVSGRFCKLA
jgi:hypothetical protein